LSFDAPRNEVSVLYERFSLDEISRKVAELIRPKNTTWRGRLDVIYQDVDGLHRAIPNHTGDWCFTGRYPTPGGYRIVNQSYLSWREEAGARPYERIRSTS
jgi:amidophosphoribosyltransferase